MDKIPSSEASTHSVSEILRLLWNQKFHYSVHKSPPLIPILNQMHAVYTFPLQFLRSILIQYSHTCLGLLSGLKDPKRIFMWYFGNRSNTQCGSSQRISFVSSLLSSVVVRIFRTIISYQWPLRVIVYYDIL